jgi:hypothetical protein
VHLLVAKLGRGFENKTLPVDSKFDSGAECATWIGRRVSCPPQDYVIHSHFASTKGACSSDRVEVQSLMLAGAEGGW